MSPSKPKRAARKASLYKPHPTFAREKEFEKKLEEETGRTLAAWIEIGRRTGETTQSKFASRLMKDHALPRMRAWWIASYAVSGQDVLDYHEPEGMVDALYSGRHAAVRPVHDAVVEAAAALGDDVIPTSCQTMVPIYRKHVFAQLKPVEAGVELLLALGDVPAKGRLAKAPNTGTSERLTHRLVLSDVKQVDDELRGWLSKAYEQGAGAMKRAASAETPADLAKALKASKPAAATWATCTPAMQRDFIVWITAAKQDETRVRRIAQSVEKLAAGKKRMY